MSLWTVARLGRRGDGVAEGEAGRALAPLTLPGEVIEGDAVNGRIAAPRILTPSDQRVRPVCGHYRVCGGCSLMHASDAFTAEWKRQVVETAMAAQGLSAPIEDVHVSPLMSRRRAVLSGRRTKKGALLGFHARASDVVVDLAQCHVMRPQITAALPLLRRIVAAGASRQAEVTLTVIHGPAGLDVAARGGKPMDAALFQALAALAEEGNLARLDWDGQAITRRPPLLPMGRARVLPPPGAFLQATAEGEAALLDAVRRSVAGAGRIADLFSGCGTFTLPLAEAAQVHAVEGLAAPLAALDSAWRNALGLNRVTTEVRDLARRPLLVDELAAFDAIVIDPPRAGAEAQSRQIAAARVPVVVMVACDPVNFAKDARVLAEAGYGIDRIWVVDQFRYSPHVEIVAALTLR
ncbi:class I SAM-dependent RNA methyltransferase [Paracoccus beibuensis]|uniref:class I SAM-dependent RNA methyltransferase n=1 Tax=Paracoccus beibuensis TaxID=547602 RepID=UPI00223EF2BD|nr:class I SAM-dependent RNA methyltransferase [Paracoccus beibuensis]